MWLHCRVCPWGAGQRAGVGGDKGVLKCVGGKHCVEVERDENAVQLACMGRGGE
jgi:hypothetical protein